MYRNNSVAVVIPAFNEESHIFETVCSVPGYVDRILVVDDASTDATSNKLRFVKRKGLEVIRHRANGGVGGAILTGYRRALCLNVQLVAVMAGDNQMDPEDLSALLDACIQQDIDYAKGNRFLKREVWKLMPKDRLLGNIVLSWLTKLATGYHHIFDSQCGYTVIRRDALLRLDLKTVHEGYGYCNDLLGHLKLAGVSVEDVPVRTIYGEETSGINIKTVFHPIASVLLRVWTRRLLAEKLSPECEKPCSVLEPEHKCANR